MNNKKIFLIILPIVIIISLIGVLKLNQYKYEIDKQNLIEGYNFKDDNEIQNEFDEDTEDKFAIRCDLETRLLKRLEDSYLVDFNIDCDRCVKKLYDATDADNRVILCDWTHNEGQNKSERLEIEKDRLYKLEIELASGKIIKKEVNPSDLKLYLNDNIFTYCAENQITLDEIGFSIISRANCEDFRYDYTNGIGGGHRTNHTGWNCNVKLDFNELNWTFEFNKVKIGISSWADGNATSDTNYTVYYTDGTTDTYSFSRLTNSSVWQYRENEFEIPNGKTIDYITFALYGNDTDCYSSQATITKVELKKVN